MAFTQTYSGFEMQVTSSTACENVVTQLSDRAVQMASKRGALG
jgi:hypothetical protein